MRRSSKGLVVAKLTKNGRATSIRGLEHGSIEHSKDSCIRGSIGFASDKHFIALSGANVEGVCSSWLRGSAVKADDSHFMSLEVEEERWESANVQDAEQVGLPGLDIIGSRLTIIHDGAVRNWRDWREICRRLEELNDVHTLLVIPVGERQGVCLVVMSVIW